MSVPAHLKEYQFYDRVNGVISVFETYFTRAAKLPATVQHFERFPKYLGFDGEAVTPDFTVYFKDGTLLVGEVARLARPASSAESIVRQIQRYGMTPRGPVAPDAGSRHKIGDVSAVDVVVLTPVETMFPMCDRIAEALQDESTAVSLVHRPTVLGYSYDADETKFVFNYSDRAGTPYPRAHGREPSLRSWLIRAQDTLQCHARHYAESAIEHRFVNDAPPPIYTATVLWQDVLPGLRPPGSTKTQILSVTVDALAATVYDRYGFQSHNAVRAGLEYLHDAGLAVQRRDDWKVEHRQIAKGRDEVHEELHRRTMGRHRRATALADDRAAARAKRDAGDATEDPQLAFDLDVADGEED